MTKIEQAIKYLQPIADSATVGHYGDMLGIALAALREQAERAKGCEFCCYQEHHDKTLYSKEGYVFYAGFSKQIDVDDFDEYETCSGVKYCPMCGRPLKGG